MLYFAFYQRVRRGLARLEWPAFCSMFIDAWAHARKPKTRLNTTLKILSSVFHIDFIECLNTADTHIRMDKTHELRKQIYKSEEDWDLVELGLQRAARRRDRVVELAERKYQQVLKKYKEKDIKHVRFCLKIENILICKAIPCVAHIFNKLFHDYKGFNNAFVFHLINNIARQRAETTEKALN